MNKDFSARETGWLAKSLAGHDKGQLYVVVGADEKNLFLADGRIKTLQKPKQKNRRHVQLVHTHVEKLYEALAGREWRNEDLIHVLHIYKKQENQADE